MSLGPVYLIGTQLQIVVEAQPLKRHFHTVEKHPPHPRVAFSETWAGTLHRRLPHLGNGECVEFLD